MDHITHRLIAISLWAVASTGAMISIIIGLVASLISPGSRYTTNILIGHDQSMNAAIGGDPDETISSRCGKRVGTCKLCYILCLVLNRLEKKHCQLSIELDEGEN